jgi:hypothetical protein
METGNNDLVDFSEFTDEQKVVQYAYTRENHLLSLFGEDVRPKTNGKLKDLKYKLNEFLPIITNKYKNTLSPIKQISPEIEEKLKDMVKDIYEPLKKYGPSMGIDFLPYNFILIKCFELLCIPEYSSNIVLTESVDKLLKYEEIWEKICKELNWSYHILML